MEAGLSYLPEFGAFGGVRVGVPWCDLPLSSSAGCILARTEMEGPTELLTLGILSTSLFCEKPNLCLTAPTKKKKRERERRKELGRLPQAEGNVSALNFSSGLSLHCPSYSVCSTLSLSCLCHFLISVPLFLIPGNF